MAPKVKRGLRDRLQKSFLERNTKIIGALGVLLILAFTFLALLLQGGLLNHRYTVHAVFSDAAGIRAGDAVTVAGLNAGRVNGVKVQGGRVVMDLGVNSSVDLTSDTSAQIRIETLLGRRSVELVDGTSSRPLQSDATIPLVRTQTPVDITDLNDISVRLLNRSDAGALNTLMEEVTTVTRGKRHELRQILTGLGRVLKAVDARRSELGLLLDALRTVSTTLGERSQTIVSLIDNLDSVLNNLAARQKALATLLRATDSASHETAGLVVRNRSVLDATLNFLHRDLQVLAHHQLDLAATVSYLDKSVEGYSSVGYSAGNFPNRWANIFVQSLGPAGVDSLIGRCGAVDQFFDHYFGTNCKTMGKAKGSPLPSPRATRPKGPDGSTSDLVPALPLPEIPPLPLPCTVGDLVSSVLGQRSGCEGR
jgi:phospholipid/cholesterol/gamma-HCH transport system substrate-binding protein